MAVQQWLQAQREHALLLAGAWKPDLAVARAAVEQAEAEVAQIRTEIERAIVRAPIDGQVLQVNVRAGERVSDQSQLALMLLGQLHPLHVRADVDEHDIALFRKEAKAVLQLRGKNDRHYPLKFVRVEPYVVAKRWLTGDNTERVDTRVLQVIYEVNSLDSAVYVGQQVDVFVDADEFLRRTASTQAVTEQRLSDCERMKEPDPGASRRIRSIRLSAVELSPSLAEPARQIGSDQPRLRQRPGGQVAGEPVQ